MIFVSNKIMVPASSFAALPSECSGHSSSSVSLLEPAFLSVFFVARRDALALGSVQVLIVCKRTHRPEPHPEPRRVFYCLPLRSPLDNPTSLPLVKPVGGSRTFSVLGGHPGNKCLQRNT